MLSHKCTAIQNGYPFLLGNHTENTDDPKIEENGL